MCICPLEGKNGFRLPEIKFINQIKSNQSNQAIQFILQVKVRKQIPLTSIVDIVYNEEENPVAFKLQFQKSEILLEAGNKRDCELWVKTITKGT